MSHGGNAFSYSSEKREAKGKAGIVEGQPAHRGRGRRVWCCNVVLSSTEQETAEPWEESRRPLEQMLLLRFLGLMGT